MMPIRKSSTLTDPRPTIAATRAELGALDTVGAGVGVTVTVGVALTVGVGVAGVGEIDTAWEATSDGSMLVDPIVLPSAETTLR